MTREKYIESVNAANVASYEYYVLSAPTMTDAAFDRLVGDIETAEGEHPEWTLPDSPTQKVGSDLGNNGRRIIRHRLPMLSCQKAQTTDKVVTWMNKLKKKLGTVPQLILSWKADGISCSLVYQDGRLIEASTRGDGATGQDLLQHVKLMRNVPQTINGMGRIEVRGEIVCPKADLEGLTDRTGKQYADCRSAASSICNQAYATADCKRLMFCPWDAMYDECENQYDVIALLPIWGFSYDCYYRESDGRDVVEILERMCGERDAQPIPIDGVVVRIINLQTFVSQGFTDHHPKGSIAFKFPAQTTTSRVHRIEITIGATGRRTPVAWFEPVTLLGRTVEKASLGSEARMEELGVTEGCTVEVGLSNDVTPKVYRVVA